jgi:hypothetical protein
VGALLACGLLDGELAVAGALALAEALGLAEALALAEALGLAEALALAVALGEGPGPCAPQPRLSSLALAGAQLRAIMAAPVASLRTKGAL